MTDNVVYHVHKYSKSNFRTFRMLTRKHLILKMQQAGLHIDWFENYLTVRLKRMKYDPCSYSNVIVDSYVLPQGTVLASLLFSIFINDLPSVLIFTTGFLFAEDNTIIITGDTKDMVHKLEQDIQTVVERLEENILQLNPTKTKSILLGTWNPKRANKDRENQGSCNGL